MHAVELLAALDIMAMGIVLMLGRDRASERVPARRRRHCQLAHASPGSAAQLGQFGYLSMPAKVFAKVWASPGHLAET
jgi:hypothetical protein